MTTDDPSSGPSFPLAGLLSITFVGFCVAAFWLGADLVETVRLIGRLMARMAAVLFSLALAASALASLFPGLVTRWLLAHRRDLALAFAAAFALHLVAVGEFYRLDPKLFWSVSPPAVTALRAIGVAFAALMLVDLRGLIDRRGWAIVSTIGGWYIWAAFLSGFARRIGRDPVYPAFVALLVLVPVVRFAAALRRRRAAAASP